MEKKRRLIVGISGTVASGKTTVAHFLEKEGMVHLRFSDSLRKVIEDMRLPETQESLQKLSESLRHTYGNDILSRGMEEDIRTAHASEPSRDIVVEGVRLLGDVVTLRNIAEELERECVILYLSASIQTRYKRMQSRDTSDKRDEKPMSLEEFALLNESQSEEELSQVAELANYSIDTGEFSENALIEKVHDFLKSYK